MRISGFRGIPDVSTANIDSWQAAARKVFNTIRADFSIVQKTIVSADTGTVDGSAISIRDINDDITQGLESLRISIESLESREIRGKITVQTEAPTRFKK